jgi:hypothetical protein
MKVAMKALVPALALVAALSLPAAVEAGHRHGPRCGHRGYYSDGYRYDGYSRGSGYGYDSDSYYDDGYRSDRYSRGRRDGYSRPYGYSSRYRGYRPRYYGHGYAPYGYDDGYGYYPPPRHRSRRPRVGVRLYFGF